MNESPSSFESYRDLVYYTLNRLNVPLPYEDLIQEAYFIYVQCIARYDPYRCKFSTYFTHKLLYFFKSYLRNDQRASPLYIERELSIDPSLDIILLHDIYSHCRLTSLEQTVVELTLEEYTIIEISEITNKSESTVKRTRKSLKNKLRRYVLQ
ncbi:sigma-70 family RNA polymerase sigma factor [Halobacillus campisalis]|uniref:RNA polymerase sigma factor SigS n=1 Tax=Halobacillus campisalis TaxID=435909 RepID=A0ABW2K4X9_9BACI|nr:sigma-70 family RNA polymerase sigma factor [Halobacillus campisalis]